MATSEPIIVIDQLKKSYGKIPAVNGISMSVEHGEIFGFLGPNGAGKTTTIRCMLDVIRPSRGTIRILGLDAQRDKLALHQYIGYLPGDVHLPGQMTGRQIINYFSRLQGTEPVLLKDLVARFDVEMKVMGAPLRSVLRLNRWRRPHEIGWESESGVIQQEGGFTFTKVSQGVRIVLKINYVPPASVVGAAVAKQIDGFVRKRLANAMERIRETLERRSKQH